MSSRFALFCEKMMGDTGARDAAANYDNIRRCGQLASAAVPEEQR